MVIKTPLVVVEQKLIVAGHYTTILYLQEQQLSLVCVKPRKHCISMQSANRQRLLAIQVFAACRIG